MILVSTIEQLSTQNTEEVRVGNGLDGVHLFKWDLFMRLQGEVRVQGAWKDTQMTVFMGDFPH